MLNKAKLSNLSTGPINYSVSESVPVVCHWDSHTLLTKDGDLIQTLEITGENISLENYDTNLSQEITSAISEYVKDYNVAIYFHTIRGRKNVMPLSTFNNEFANRLNNDWCHKNNFNKQLINTVYITLIYKGKSYSILNFSNILKSLFFPLIKKEQIKRLEKSYEKLEEIATQILQKLQTVGARRLDLIETDEGIISEQLVFYYYLLHMDQRKVQLVTHDFSGELAMQKVKFNFNTIEIDNFENVRYAAVYTLKDYYNLPPKRLNQLLQLGLEYIITQAIIFVPAKVAKKEYEVMADIAKLSNQENLNHINGLDAFLNSQDNGNCSYCKQQTTITIFSDDKAFFENKINQLTTQLHEIGLASIREDFNMAALFFGQLPGNFRFLRNGRFSYLDTKRIGAYCAIYDKDVGNYLGSKWGAPISLLRTDKGTPYYFNFHNKGGIGHTLIVGPKTSGKTVLSRFLITQSLKNDPKIIYIDFEGSSKIFLETIGGVYLCDQDIKDNYRLNPFDNASFKNNPNLFKDWLIDCIFPKAKEVRNYDEVFEAIANKICQNPDMSNKADAICALFASLNDRVINNSAQKFFKESDTFQHYMTEDAVKFENPLKNNKIVGIDLSKFAHDDQAFKAYVGLFVENMLNSVDEGPCIIYINMFEKLFSLNHLKKVLPQLLTKANESNIIVVFNCQHQNEFEKDDDFQLFTQTIATQVFLGDKDADKYFKRCYQLTDDELHKIKSYSSQRRIFLVKQDDKYKLLSLNLKGLESDLAILDTAYEK